MRRLLKQISFFSLMLLSNIKLSTESSGGEHFLANPNCPLRNFLHYLEEKLNIQNPETQREEKEKARTGNERKKEKQVDLYDEQLNLKLLFQIKDLNENIENLFEHRGIYHACKIERNPLDNAFKSIIPLEENASENLITTLQNQCVTLDQQIKQKSEKNHRGLKDYGKVQRRGKGSSKAAAEDEPVVSRASGRTRTDQGKKSGKIMQDLLHLTNALQRSGSLPFLGFTIM
ncbi:uncharacterized protein CXorf65-like isoform X3 [Narcine bancroftii]|uniref:uncharacterized protein CXorf65-like isoform X3 n=1 Tax=Narcine bancroftii TaxID=1343680 RepID=UPI0038312200